MSVNAITIDSDGLKIKSYVEIRTALAADYVAQFPDLDTSPGSPDGAFVDLVAYAISEIAQGVQRIFGNIDVATSEGVYLDYIANIAGLPRSDGESDESLRLRLSTASHSGLATFDNMLTYLRANIDAGVSMQANSEDVFKGGVPAHSFVVFVPESFEPPSSWEGSREDYIAKVIWTCKPAGIASSGISSGVCVDVGGHEHTVRFSSISSSVFDLEITITRYNEEALPSNYVDLVKESVVGWANEKITPGKDLIPQRFCVPIYENVDGIENVEVRIKEHSSSDWSSEIIRINADVSPSINAENISVRLV